MSRKHIIFVPGKNPKPPRRYYERQLWRSLIKGVQQINPLSAKLMERSVDFSIIDWNKHYYGTEKDEDLDRPWLDKMLNAVQISDTHRAEAHAWQYRLGSGIYGMADYFSFLVDYLPGAIQEMVEETNRYFSNQDGIALKIRDMLKSELKPLLDTGEDVLLIAHSFGSIIAYDSLWELSQQQPQNRVKLFLSLGSPLGLNYVQGKLLGHEYWDHRRFPNCIQQWCNIACEGDIIALRRVLQDGLFSQMKDLGLLDDYQEYHRGIYNAYRDDKGVNCHHAYGYLANPQTARNISDWYHQRQQLEDTISRNNFSFAL